MMKTTKTITTIKQDIMDRIDELEDKIFSLKEPNDYGISLSAEYDEFACDLISYEIKLVTLRQCLSIIE